MPTITIPYHREFAVSFKNGTTVTVWATFFIRSATEIRFFSGAPLTSIGTHGSAPTGTSTEAHNLAVGDKIAFAGVRSISPDVNTASATTLYTVGTVPSSTTFTFAENVTVAGAGGYVGKLLEGWLDATEVASVRPGRFVDQRDRDNHYY